MSQVHNVTHVPVHSTAIPSVAEAELIADVRRKMNDLMGLDMNYLTAESVLTRYRELIAASGAKANVQ
jgi:hypothetical protein